MNPYQCKISLRVYHPTTNPDRISQELGLVPKRKWLAGAARTTPTGRPLKGVYGSSYWVAELIPKATRSFPECVDNVVMQLQQHRVFLDEITQTGGRLEFYIACFTSKNSGETIDWKLLQKLSALRVSLAIDIYPEQK